MSIEYRHLAPAYLGDELACTGTVSAVEDHVVEFDLRAQKADGATTTAGKARFALR